MTQQRNLSVRNILIPQTIFTSPESSSLARAFQALLALSAVDGVCWYDVSTALSWNGPTGQVIVVHAIVSDEADATFMDAFTAGIEARGIVGVKSWVYPLTTLGYGSELTTGAQAQFTIPG